VGSTGRKKNGVKKLRVTYAHMGTSTIVFKSMLEEIGHEVIAPPRPTPKTLSLGVQYAPEFACIPFKLVLGTYLETLPEGAEMIVSAGGYGPCRAGFYGELHRRILREMGYNPKIVFFFPPLKKPLDFYRKLVKLKQGGSWVDLYRAVRKGFSQLRAVDDIEIKSHETRARELNRGDTNRAFKKGIDYLEEAKNLKEIEEARSEGLKALEKVPQNPDFEPLKVGIIGEIYVQLEPAANFYLEETLGNMGVVPRRTIFLTSFTRRDVVTHGEKEAKERARPYIPLVIGGHGQNSVGDVVHFAEKGYHGVVQLAPFTCIPEIVAKSIMPHLSKVEGIPVLTFFIDEQTGQAGVETRLEAFVDLMNQQRGNFSA